MKCSRCHWDYPSQILSPFISSAGNRQNCCGICALELKNEIHGTRWEHFDGSIAEQMRLEAVQWRKRHPKEVVNARSD